MKPFNLDQPLIEINSKAGNSYWTVRHAVEGTQIFGGIGSGKTSGSGRMLALKYLQAGFGGLVLTAKPDEKQTWQEYCRLTGREQDLLVLEPGGKHHFNFLAYESAQADGQKAITDNIVEVLKTVIRASAEKESGRKDDAFWESALDLLLFNAVDLCQLAYDSVSIQQLFDIVQTIPKGKDDLKAKIADEKAQAKPFFKTIRMAQEKINKKVEDLRKSIPEEVLESWDEQQFEEQVIQTFPDARLLRLVDQFFFDNLAILSDKTRSIIDFTFSAFLVRLLREPMHSLFCQGQSTVIPEDSLAGKIILLNIPVKVYQKAGRDCQILFKYIWQRAMEKRDVNQNPWPVFLWADEAQHFLHEHDADYQATARSSRIATVYISQNLPNYYAGMGGDKSDYRVKSFLGTLGTKIFHANADIETNQYASSLIGDVFYENHSNTVNVGKELSHSDSKSLKLERAVRPEELVRLRTGGPLNHFRVDGYFHRQGNAILEGLNYAKITFNQQYFPTSSV